MEEIYVVTTLTEDGYEYLKYEGEDRDTASEIYEEFKNRKNKCKVSFYKKTIIEEVDKRRRDNMGITLMKCSFCEKDETEININECEFCGDFYCDDCECDCH